MIPVATIWLLVLWVPMTGAMKALLTALGAVTLYTPAPRADDDSMYRLTPTDLRP